MKHLQLAGVAWSAWLLIFVGASASAQELPTKEIYKRTLKATAWVLQSKGTGTGWVVDVEKKLLITNAHVVGANETVTVMFPAYEGDRAIPERSHYVRSTKGVRGEVLISDPRHDLALIRVDSLPPDVTALELARESASPSDRVHSIGNPAISEALWLYTSGTVRQVYRRKVKFEDQEIDARVLETQAPLNPGDSGGPVVNDEGELVGVSAAINRAGQLFSICIDVSEVREFKADFPRLLDPKTPDDFMRSASLKFYKKLFEQAIKDYDEAIRLDPTAARSYRNRGIVHLRRGDVEKAIGDCSKAIELDKNDLHAYLTRSRAYRQRNARGDADRAQADQKEANRINPALAQ